MENIKLEETGQKLIDESVIDTDGKYNELKEKHTKLVEALKTLIDEANWDIDAYVIESLVKKYE